MNRKLILVALLALLPSFPLRAEGAATGPMIVIKADDMKVGNSGHVPAQWQRFVDFIKERKIKANIGIICESLEGEKPAYFKWIKDLQATGQFEFWLHAYDHKSWTASDGVEHQEFAARTFEEQLGRFKQCQDLAKQKLGFAFHTFGPPGTGAPGPGFDENTIKAMQAEPDMKVWLYNAPIDEPGKQIDAAGKVTVLDRVWQVNIEHPIFKPSLAELQSGYRKYAGKRDYFVIQGHPQHWDEEGFSEFVKLVDFLTEQGATFVTATECAEKVKHAPAGNSSPAHP